LGPNRALFIHEETGTLEKFRPYAFPSAEWLDKVAAEMAKRPQGTPVNRPSAAPAAPATAAESGGFTAFGGGDFNFSKMLDDGPDESPPAGES
jgi:hypothetical protein